MGDFLVRSNETYDEFRLTYIEARNTIQHLKLLYKDEKFFLDNRLDEDKKFNTLDDLITFFQSNKLSHQRTLKKPVKLKQTEIHKQNDWFVGKLEEETCKDIMKNVKKKGLFLVREADGGVYTDDYIVEYFDGMKHQQLKVKRHPGGEINLPQFPHLKNYREFETITQVVNHFRKHFLINATKLGEVIQLRGELLEDVTDKRNTLKKGQYTSFKRVSSQHAVFKNDNKIERSKLKITQDGQRKHYGNPDAMDNAEKIDMTFAEVSTDDFHSLYDKLKDMKEKIVITTPDAVLEVTKDKYLDVLYEGLKRKCQQLQNTPNTKRKQTYMEQANQLCTEITDLVIYCQKRDTGLDLKKIHDSITMVNLKKRPHGAYGMTKLHDHEDCIESHQMAAMDSSSMLAKVTPNMKDYATYHEVILTRIFPTVSRVFCQNFNPIPLWNSGAQLVSLHVQTPGRHMQVNSAMFATNGGCGYVLKPDGQEDDTNCLITLKILEARHIMTLKPHTEPFLKPHIRVGGPIQTFMCALYRSL
jgi:hypothetical protein